MQGDTQTQMTFSFIAACNIKVLFIFANQIGKAPFFFFFFVHPFTGTSTHCCPRVPQTSSLYLPKEELFPPKAVQLLKCTALQPNTALAINLVFSSNQEVPLSTRRIYLGNYIV